MSQQTIPVRTESPPPRQLAKATAAAFAAAALVLITAVLPAEYGIDPLGTGRAMGLTALSSPTEAPQVVLVAPRGPEGVPAQHGPVATYQSSYRTDSVELTIGPYEFVEYKYRLEKGASMLYSWAASAPVIHDMHGEPDGAPKDYSESFDKQTRRQADGAFTAPFSGIHGWFWENSGGETITVRLTSSGFYSAALEIRSDRTRTPHALTSLEDVTFPEGR
jgi:hypothetical protein